MGTGFGQPVKISLALSGPSSVAVDPGGDLYISDTLDARIDELSWTGTSYSTVQQVGSYHKAPTGVAVDGTGEVNYSAFCGELDFVFTRSGGAWKLTDIGAND